MSILDLAKKNRSYRGFNENRRISREELVSMVECARYCASSINIQPLRFHLAWEKDEVDRIQQETNWARALPQMKLPHDGMCPTAFIVVMQDKRIFESLQRFQKDVGIVAQTILLAAVEMGLGGCMICNFNAATLKETLGLDENLSPLMIIAIGEPMEEVVITDLEPGENHQYYRDENDVHYVPKRKLEDLIV